MIIPEALKNSALLQFLIALVIGFGAGYGTYREMLVVSNQVPVAKVSYVLKADITGPMVVRRDAIRDIDKLIDEGGNLPNDQGAMTSWLQQVAIFIHYLGLPAEVSVDGERISHIEKSIRYAQQDPILRVQVRKTLGALKGFRDAEEARSQP